MYNMKLKALIPETIDRINKRIIKEKFILFMKDAKENKRYIKDFDVYVAACLRDAIYKPNEICDIMYGKYKANDKHIITLILHCMKETGLVI